MKEDTPTWFILEDYAITLFLV